MTNADSAGRSANIAAQNFSPLPRQERQRRESSRMFRDASQPVRSSKLIPTVCVIRLLIVIPPTIPEFKLHPAIRSQSSSGATFASARQPDASRRSAPFRGAQRQSWSQPMATGCSPLSAFVSTSEPVGKHAVGVSKSSELSRVSAPTPTYPNRACPTVFPCDEQLLS